MHILITGGTGFVGSKLSDFLFNKGYKISILTRDKNKVNSKYTAIENIDEISPDAKIDYIVNLAGASIDKKWTDSYKQELIDSRVNVTAQIIKLIEKLDTKPKRLISGSAIGFYGTSADDVFDENSPAPNDDQFTAKLCKSWEQEALNAKTLGLDTKIIRLGVVLGQKGALKKMLPPFKLGLGGKIGTGKQFFSWIHIDDVVSAIDFLIKNETTEYIFNLTSPNIVTNSEFTSALGKILKRPTFFSVPAITIKLLFGEMGKELLLKGQKVLPNNLQKAEFKFQYANIDEALSNIL